MRKKRYRRRRFRRSRMSYKRRYRRRSRRIPSFTEVKTYSSGINSQIIKVNLPGTADKTQYPEAFLYNSILNSIVQGTDYFNRIGNQIYVLSVKVKLNVWMCSQDEYELNTGLLRINIGEPIGTALTTSFADYYRSNGKDRIVMPLNRKTYTFHYDRTYKIESGFPNRLTDATDSLKYAGSMRHIEFNIPINRRVEYTTNGAVKNQRDQLSLFATGLVPNAINTQSIMCSNWYWTTYFTDV